MARAGVNYGSGAVLGLPLEGLETSLNTIAQGHANDLTTNNIWGHTGSNGQSPFDRINNNGTFEGTCHQFMSYAENIYAMCSTSSIMPEYLVEQAVFAWLYRDASSSWGHRRAILIQNNDRYGAVGFTNNYGSSTSEGFLGIGIATSSSYSAGGCGASFPNGFVIVMNIADPAASECIYNVVSSTLPVGLVFFAGSSRNQKAELTWATSWEKESLGFKVLRSGDVRSWEEIGFVESGGNKSEGQNYRFVDENVQPGQLWYYKLRQHDMSGRHEESKVIAVRIEAKTDELYVYPNPSENGRFQVVLGNTEGTKLALYTQTGIEIPIQTTALGLQNMEVQVLSTAATGVYHLHVTKASGRSYTLTVMLQSLK